MGKGPAQQAPRRRPTSTLWQNLGTAVERSVRRHNNCLKSAAVSDEGLTNDAVADHADAEKEMSPIETRIRERHATVHALLAQGHGIREIARELHMGGNTVRRTARAETPEQLLTGRRQTSAASEARSRPGGWRPAWRARSARESGCVRRSG
ncbi:hypothetical protein [Streptomyces mirabilis]|uniref:hypothetical protein n=1 Tax=Streptomyces mirabilis TaxID=68239 RepID=UPI002255D56C|nr:hypothetical protein [Streptomyces mirabilis]MCX4617749.1 hypothetical protein [Streptomyces mirabilis]